MGNEERQEVTLDLDPVCSKSDSYESLDFAVRVREDGPKGITGERSNMSEMEQGNAVEGIR